MKKIIIFLSLIFMSSVAFARFISEEQYQQILKRFEEDKQLFLKNDDKWNKLRKQIPQIKYKQTDSGIVVEKILIPVENDNPLEYISEFKVIISNRQEGYFPLKLRFYGGVENPDIIGEKIKTDIKLGIKLIGLNPLNVPILKNFGLNALVGFNGFGGSISYDLPKPVANTSIHFFMGTSYTWNYIMGIGIALNF